MKIQSGLMVAATLATTAAATVRAQNGNGPVMAVTTVGTQDGNGSVSVTGSDGNTATYSLEVGAGALNAVGVNQDGNPRVIVAGQDGSVQSYNLGIGASGPPVVTDGGGGAGPIRMGGNVDPAEMMQRMQQSRLDNIRTQLGITNDDEWNVIRALVQKIFDARQAVQGAFAGRPANRGGGPAMASAAPMAVSRFDPNGSSKPDPSVTALQTAVDSGASGQLRAALANYRKAKQSAQDKLGAAQDALQKVLTLKQEAVAVQLGLLN